MFLVYRETFLSVVLKEKKTMKVILKRMCQNYDKSYLFLTENLCNFKNISILKKYRGSKNTRVKSFPMNLIFSITRYQVYLHNPVVSFAHVRFI